MRSRAALFVAAMMALQTLPLVQPASTGAPGTVPNPVGIPAATWTGVKYVNTSILVPAGGVLTIENATVIWGTNATTHLDLTVAPGGKLVVRDSTIENGMTGAPDLLRAKGYWTFADYGVVDIQRSVLRHASDLCIQADGADGSILKDVDWGWSSRGIEVLRTNFTGTGTTLTLDNVTIHDIPSLGGGGCSNINGAVAIEGGTATLRNVTIARALLTGLFVDRSTVTQDTGATGDEVHAQDLLVISGSPDGAAQQSYLGEIRTKGAFTCDRCAFVAPHGNGIFLVDDGAMTFRGTTMVDTHLDVTLLAGAPVVFDGLRMLGPRSQIVYEITNNAYPTFRNVSFDAGVARAANDQWPLNDRRAPLTGVWWGDPSGPSDVDITDHSFPLTNGGAGRAVAGPINYAGWATSAPADFHALRLGLPALPLSAAPGAPLSVAVAVANAGDAPQDVALSTESLLAATVTPSALRLDPGQSATITVSLPIPLGLAPGTPVSADLLARGQGDTAVAVVGTTVAPDHPTLTIDAPRPLDAVSGAVDVAGRVLEPLPGTLASSDPVGDSGLGPLDVNGDRVDDRVQLAPGVADVLIVHDGKDEASLRGDVEARGGVVVRAFDVAPIVWATLDASQLPDLARSHGIRGIWMDEEVAPQLALNVRAIRARTSQEGVLPGGAPTGANYPGVWRGDAFHGYQGDVGKGVLVAVVDSGIDSTHASLDDMDDGPLTHDPKVVGHVSTAAVLATGDSDVAPSDATTPGAHATMVAGALAGTGAGFLGSPDAPLDVSTPEDLWLHAGAAPGAQLLDVQAFQETTAPVHPSASGLDVLPSVNGVGLAIQGFQAVLDWNRAHPTQQVRVVSCSLGLGDPSPEQPVNEAANALVDSGVVVIVAAGNNQDFLDAPASASKVLAVGAVDTSGTVARGDDYHARFSDVVDADQYAAGLRKPELVAPGVGITMPNYLSGDGYVSSSGTSFAAPLASAVAALVISANPNLTAQQVKEILIRSAEPRGGSDPSRYTDVDLDGLNDLDQGGWTRDWGYGYLDAEQAVRLARETAPRAPPAPPLETLYADGAALAETEPAQTGVAPPPATFSMPAPRALVVGDEDPATQDVATLLLDAPASEPEPADSQGVATLSVNGVVVAQTIFNDTVIGDSPTAEEIAVPLVLGQVTRFDTTGPDAGRYDALAALPGLDAKGDLAIPQGAVISLTVDLKDFNHAPSPIVTGPGGTRLALPLDPAALPDAEPPTAVSGVRAAWDATSADVSWGPAGDNVAVGGYVVTRDGAAIATLPRSAHEYRDVGLAPASQHAYTVRAFDLRGNAGPDAPEVSVATPPASGRALVVDFDGASALATDAAGDGTFDSWRAQLLPVAPGRHTLRASLYENGTLLDARTEELTLAAGANLPPLVTLDPVDALVHGLRNFTFRVRDPNGASDITSVLAQVDDGPWFPTGEGVASVSVAGLADGPHALRVVATDASGATGEGQVAFTAQPWVADLAVPDVVLDGAPQDVGVSLAGTNASAARATLVGSGVASFAVPISSGRATMPPLPSGALRLRVVQEGEVLGERSVLVDRPPVALALGAPARATRLDAITLRDASLDDGGIAQRTWTLPGGATSHAATLLLSPFALPVGDDVVRLDVANVHGLVASTNVTIRVADLAPLVTAGPWRLGNLTVDHALTGEPISLALNVSDPEADPMNVTGATAGAQTFRARPDAPGNLTLDVTAADPWLVTKARLALPVLQNQPPIAALDAPALARAGVPVRLDASASRDPDRLLVDREIAVPGVLDAHAGRADVALPLGFWNATATVTDTSGATASATRQIVADDWLSLARVTYVAPTLTTNGFARFAAAWSDGAPAAGATLDVTVTVDTLGLQTSRQTITLDAAGRGVLLIPMDTPLANLPGAHTLRAVASAAARPIAPLPGEKTTGTAFGFTI